MQCTRTEVREQLILSRKSRKLKLTGTRTGDHLLTREGGASQEGCQDMQTQRRKAFVKKTSQGHQSEVTSYGKTVVAWDTGVNAWGPDREELRRTSRMLPTSGSMIFLSTSYAFLVFLFMCPRLLFLVNTTNQLSRWAINLSNPNCQMFRQLLILLDYETLGSTSLIIMTFSTFKICPQRQFQDMNQ